MGGESEEERHGCAQIAHLAKADSVCVTHFALFSKSDIICGLGWVSASKRLLTTAVGIIVQEVPEGANQYGGVCYSSHRRPTYASSLLFLTPYAAATPLKYRLSS